MTHTREGKFTGTLLPYPTHCTLRKISDQPKMASMKSVYGWL